MALFTSARTPLLAGMAALAYALVCAALLVENLYLGALAALAPALLLAVLAVRSSSGSLMSVRGRAAAAWLLLLAAASPWQTLSVTSTGAIAAGSEADAAKFLVSAVAFALALLVRPVRLRYPWPVKALLAYAALAALGGLAGPDPASSSFRAIRFAAVAMALVWLTGSLDRTRLAKLFTWFCAAVALIALAARVAGLAGSHLYGSRLDGYLPPLHPNSLGLLAAAGLLCGAALLTRRELPARAFLAPAVILALALVLSQSRTSMLALLVGLLALAGPRMATRGPAIVGLLALALLVGVFIQTNSESQPLSALLTHNGATTATGTLGSRFSEWESVLALNDSAVSVAVGQGLAAKSVAVNLSSARYAPVDGTWPAAYLSAGMIGVLALACAVLSVLRTAARRRDDFALAIVCFLVVSSLTADVFNDVTAGLILLFSVGMGGVSVAIPGEVARASGPDSLTRRRARRRAQPSPATPPA